LLHLDESMFRVVNISWDTGKIGHEESAYGNDIGSPEGTTSVL